MGAIHNIFKGYGRICVGWGLNMRKETQVKNNISYNKI